jgi:hypothetical protein
MDPKEAHSLCLQHLHRYVSVRMTDGSTHDGIVASVDQYYLHLAVPTGEAEEAQTRAFQPFGYPGYGGYGGYPFVYPGYGFPGYGYGYGYPRRRFFRRSLPLVSLLFLSLLPYY